MMNIAQGRETNYQHIFLLILLCQELPLQQSRTKHLNSQLAVCVVYIIWLYDLKKPCAKTTSFSLKKISCSYIVSFTQTYQVGPTSISVNIFHYEFRKVNIDIRIDSSNKLTKRMFSFFQVSVIRLLFTSNFQYDMKFISRN